MDIENQMQEQDAGRYNTLNPLYEPENRDEVIDSLQSDVEETRNNVDLIVTLETLGIPLGSMLADRLKCRFTVLRERGKFDIPEQHLARSRVPYEHRDKFLVLDKRKAEDGDTIVLVDDWIESGKQIETAVPLLQDAGCEIVCIATIGTDHSYEFPYDCSLFEFVDR